MLDRNALVYEMKKNNCSIEELANVCGVSRSAMYRRLRGQVDFRVGEIIRCTGRLYLSPDRRNAIFFAQGSAT